MKLEDTSLEGDSPKDLVRSINSAREGKIGELEVLIKVACLHSICLMRNRKVFEGETKFEEALLKIGHLVEEFSIKGESKISRSGIHYSLEPPLLWDTLPLTLTPLLATGLVQWLWWLEIAKGKLIFFASRW